MKPLALGVFEDLRRRGLLPVVGVLLAALVAIPVLMLDRADPAPVPAPAPAAAVRTAGLPSPQQALQGDKPLVSLAVLKKSSDLDSFTSKNPFEPIDEVSDEGAAPSVAQGPVSTAPPPSAGGSTATVAPSGDLAPATPAGSGGGVAPGGGSPGGKRAPQAPASPPKTPAPGGKEDGGAQPKPKTLTYTIDATLQGPYRTARYRGLQKLSALPGAQNPLFIYLGVDSTGDNAVFLVDSTLTGIGGEGVCQPSAESCGMLTLEPGQVQVFRNAQGQRYMLRIDQIREVSASAAASSARKAHRRAENGEHVSGKPGHRFVPPLIADLFVRAEQ